MVTKKNYAHQLFCQFAGLIEDTTYPSTTRSADPHRASIYYSGRRGKGQVGLQGHLTDCAGRVEACRPGDLPSSCNILLTTLTQGVMSSATPRCGDGAHWAMQVFCPSLD